MQLSRFRPQFTVRRLMVGVTLASLLIWGEQTRRRWVHYHSNYLYFSELELENLEMLANLPTRTYGYCGMAKPCPKSQTELDEDETCWRSGVVEELEHNRARKEKYTRAMWRPWAPLEPDAFTPPESK